MTGHRDFLRKPEPSPETLYGRRVLSQAAALIRDGQVGGNSADFGIDPVDAARARAEVAGWLDMFAASLKNVFPTTPALNPRPRQEAQR